MITIYNSLTRQKETLQPNVAGKIGLYVCGMTVYDFCHIGHARVLVVFDTVVRHLRHLGFAVDYVRNITDIDDKIIRRAGETGESIDELTSRYIKAMHEDAALLGVLPPTQEPRATGHIPQIIALIERLVTRDYAYQGEDGDVFFRVRRFAGYGRLSGKSLDQLRAGARVDANESKSDPLDFVLWKRSKPGEPRWDSPWGEGRPGWHIECSAMSTHCLGENFDIHAGGQDLQFPHHENEIAQSEGATGKPFVNIWMHNGYVQIDQEKMSKSLGNFFTIREILDGDSDRQRMGEIIRYMMMDSHYRSPLNFSTAVLKNSKIALTRIYMALDKLSRWYGSGAWPRTSLDPREDPAWKEFDKVMNDDFNTSRAVAVIHDQVRELNRHMERRDMEASLRSATRVMAMGEVLGLLGLAPDRYLQGVEGVLEDSREDGQEALDEQEILKLIAEREAARKDRNFQAADAIRETLSDSGIILEDSAEGTTWRRR